MMMMMIMMMMTMTTDVVTAVIAGHRVSCSHQQLNSTEVKPFYTASTTTQGPDDKEGDHYPSINFPQLALASHSITHARHNPNGSEENAEVSNLTSFHDVHASPNVSTFGQFGQPSLNNSSQKSACKSLRPPLMPKPSLARHAAAEVAERLLAPQSGVPHVLTDDDAAAALLVDSAVYRGRTTPDGGSDSETDQRESSTSSHSQTSTTSTASCKHLPAVVTDKTVTVDGHSLPGDHCTFSHNEVATHQKMIDRETRLAITIGSSGKDGPWNAAVDKVGVNGLGFGTLNSGWGNDVTDLTAEQAGLSKVSDEEQHGLRESGNVNRSEERPTLLRRTGGKCVEKTPTDVNVMSHQLGTEIILLEKGVFGLGFCIEGGRDCPTGRVPVTVKRIFRGELLSTFLLLKWL